MGRDVQDWCLACDACTAKKRPVWRMRAPLQLHQVGAPLERVAMDIMGPLPPTRQGNRDILVMIDSFPKWPEAFALPNQEAEVVARAFVEGFACWYGIPQELHMDQGRNFESIAKRGVQAPRNSKNTHNAPETTVGRHGGEVQSDPGPTIDPLHRQKSGGLGLTSPVPPHGLSRIPARVYCL